MSEMNQYHRDYPDTLLTKPDRTFSREEGWGVDLDPAMRPGVPKEWPSDVRAVRGNVHIPRQITDVKIHQSMEHPDLTPVFGTTCPPKGLSGMLRNVAYEKFSEERLAHWMLLLLADRVDVIEGVIGDVAKAKLPNPAKEMGLDSHIDLRSRRTRNLVIAGAGVGLIALGVAIAMRQRE